MSLPALCPSPPHPGLEPAHLCLPTPSSLPARGACKTHSQSSLLIRYLPSSFLASTSSQILQRPNPKQVTFQTMIGR